MVAELQKKYQLPPPERVSEESERIAAGQFMALMEDLLQRGYADVGLNMGIAMPVGGFGSFSYLMLSAANMKEMLDQYCHYYGIIASGDRMPIWKREEKEFYIEFYLSDGRDIVKVARSDFILACTVHMFQQALPSFYPTKIYAYGDGYSYKERYKDVLNTKHIEFNAQTLRIYGRLDILEKSFPNANPSLCKVFRKELDMLLRQINSEENIIDQIQQMMAQADNLRDMNLGAIAEQLKIGERTLARQLAEYDISFRDLLANYKSTRAIRLLAQGKTVDQVSYYLGFSERAAFDRAFKKWQGVTASRFQEDYNQSGATEMDILSNDQLPNLPMAAKQILSMINDGNYNMDELAAIVEQDPSLTAKLLALANSAMYGVLQINSIKDAIVKVFGVDTLRNLALGMLAGECFDTSRCASFSIKFYWVHSLATGQLANEIAKESGLADPSDTYLLGLLHNIGTLLLVQTKPIEANKVFANEDLHWLTLKEILDVETKEMGVDTCSAGAMLASFWNLPKYLSVGIRYLADEKYKGEYADMIKIIAACEYYVRLIKQPDKKLDAIEDLEKVSGLDHQRVKDMLSSFESKISELESVAEAMV